MVAGSQAGGKLARSWREPVGASRHDDKTIEGVLGFDSGPLQRAQWQLEQAGRAS